MSLGVFKDDFVWILGYPNEGDYIFTPRTSQMVLVVKNPPDNVGDMGSIPGLGRFPGVINGNPLQYSCLENSMSRRTWWAPVQGPQNIRHNWLIEHMHASKRTCAHTHTHTHTHTPRSLDFLFWPLVLDLSRIPFGSSVNFTKSAHWPFSILIYYQLA